MKSIQIPASVAEALNINVESKYSTKDIKDETHIKVKSPKEFEQAVKDMGFDDLKDFLKDTGIDFKTVKGKWWLLINNHHLLMKENKCLI